MFKICDFYKHKRNCYVSRQIQRRNRLLQIETLNQPDVRWNRKLTAPLDKHVGLSQTIDNMYFHTYCIGIVVNHPTARTCLAVGFARFAFQIEIQDNIYYNRENREPEFMLNSQVDDHKWPNCQLVPEMFMEISMLDVSESQLLSIYCGLNHLKFPDFGWFTSPSIHCQFLLLRWLRWWIPTIMCLGNSCYLTPMTPSWSKRINIDTATAPSNIPTFWWLVSSTPHFCC